MFDSFRSLISSVEAQFRRKGQRLHLFEELLIHLKHLPGVMSQRKMSIWEINSDNELGADPYDIV